MKKNALNFFLGISLTVLYSCGTQSHQSTSEINTVNIETTEKRSIAHALREKSHLPVEARVALYRQLKQEDPNGYNFDNEDEMTMYGYSLLWDGKTEEAIAIFQLIVDQFPESSNPYDSLGEGYMALGDTTKAIANYKRSLELNPDNFNADDQIERMRYPDRKPPTPAERFVQVFSPEEYLADLDELGRKLLEVHPNALKFTTEKDFLKLIEEKKALITEGTTYGTFAWHCSEIIAAVNCSHTAMGSFYMESEMLPLSSRFPLQLRWVNDQLYIVDPLNNGDQVAVKDELSHINEIPVAQLVQDIYKHIPTQGHIETTKRHYFNTWATCLIAYALNFPTTYTIRIKGKAEPITLDPATNHKDPYWDQSIPFCEKNLCFEMLDDGRTALMTISSFNYYPWNNLTEFEVFMDSSFAKIEKEGVSNLLIDLRFNQGGSPESAIHLLRYLVQEPFVYSSTSETYQAEQPPFKNAFNGNCYFIIDGWGNSTTGHFMSLAKVLELGTIVGEELGSNQFCTAGQVVCRLKNTKLQYYVANSTHETTATTLPDETGILPDHYVTQGIDEYLNEVDVVKEYVLDLIGK